jgi:hypothetical protein
MLYSPSCEVSCSDKTFGVLQIVINYFILFSSKSQSLTNAFGLKETSFFRTASEDVAKAETMRNLRKSFVSLFSD